MMRLAAGACALLAAIAMLLAFGMPARAEEVPYLTGRVVDNAEILKPATRERVAALAKAHEDKTTDQIAVLTVSTLGGESVEEFANRVFAAWKLGQKGKDNGVLVVVAPQDRKMRIEVGYGLEGTLTDVSASRIIRNVMTPAFKNGDFDRGIEDGVAAIVAQLEGQPSSSTTASFVDAPAAGAQKSTFRFEGPDIPWYMRILLGCFIFGIIGLFTVVGVMTPGMGWFLYVFLIPFWAMFPIIIIGPKATVGLLGLYLIGYPTAKLWFARQPWYAKAAADLKAKGKTTIGGMVITSGGSWSSGGSSGNGGGGGGFSGGGGSSGGGGASGSW
jgi:uncharacterized protein